jgi:hypothetical protein
MKCARTLISATERLLFNAMLWHDLNDRKTRFSRFPCPGVGRAAPTRALATWVKPELVHEINALAQDEQTSVSALLEEAAINLLRERGIEFPDYMRHYRKDATEVAP